MARPRWRLAIRRRRPGPTTPSSSCAQTKVLSPRWLYDRIGRELLARITGLPQHGLARTETAILRRDARRLPGRVPGGAAIVELGSGASVKIRHLLGAGPQIGAYVPVDISADFLHATADGLRARYPTLAVHPVIGDFTGPVALPAALASMPMVGFLPGSTIGHLPLATARSLLRGAWAWPRVKAVVLGANLVRYGAILMAAYDKSQGVTGAVIGNAPARPNRGLGASFDRDAFAYEAAWNATATQIEIRTDPDGGVVVAVLGAPRRAAPR
jgi:uncharacterized SAM-dependent methyltransferase